MSPAKERLIVFTRFPEPGRAKTRLIPALGESGAAEVHAALARHALAVAQAYQQLRPAQVELEVRYAGGNLESMQAAFGTRFDYAAQQGSDLGTRIAGAAADAFSAGRQRVLIMGADCPELDPAILLQASDALRSADLVLGPAIDGGYYLVGLRANQAAIFHGISWGTEHVLRQTLDVARRLRLKTWQLRPLSDVDHPEDLILCRQFPTVLPASWPAVRLDVLSVVIPALNEAGQLELTLRPLLAESDIEIIVADGGSQDGTRAIAHNLGARVVGSRPGRGRQMNAGAAVATGDTLLFLHADTRLPENFRDQVRRTLGQNCCAGAFRLRIDGHQRGFRWIEWAANQRSRWLQLPYGDQGLFLSAERFYRTGGFANLPLMEDVEFCRRLRTQGRIGLATEDIVTSSRRWHQLGLLRTTLTNQMCLAGYCLGVSAERLAQWYRRQK